MPCVFLRRGTQVQRCQRLMARIWPRCQIPPPRHITAGNTPRHQQMRGRMWQMSS
jgi:hypothetical protein